MSKKERLMQAAEKLFRAQLVHEITLDDVIREADVGKGTVYRYFADKNDLFFETAVSGFGDMCQALRNIPLEGVPFRTVMLQACRTIRTFFQERRPLFRMIMTEDDRTRIKGGSLRQRWLKHRKQMTAAMAAIIARGVDSGEVKVQMPPAVLVEYLLGMMRTCANELSEADECWRTEEAVVDLFLRGVSGSCVSGKKQSD